MMRAVDSRKTKRGEMMGIKERVGVEVTCDLCGAECKESDGKISVEVRPGDGRDVGPSVVIGRLRLESPYVCTNGLLCKRCVISSLKGILRELERNDDM